MRKREIVITALICTIICVIICTCVFVVIKNNNKTDIESENPDYYNDTVDDMRIAEDFNLGVISVTEFQDDRIGRNNIYFEGIGVVSESSCPPTRDVVENVNKNLGLTDDDRLNVNDVVNNGDRSLTGRDKVINVYEVIRKKLEENVETEEYDARPYRDFFDVVM